MDPNRVLDLVFEAYERWPANDGFAELLRLFRTENFAQVLGFKFQCHAKAAAAALAEKEDGEAGEDGVLKDRRSQRERGRMGTSVTRLKRALAADALAVDGDDLVAAFDPRARRARVEHEAEDADLRRVLRVLRDVHADAADVVLQKRREVRRVDEPRVRIVERADEGRSIIQSDVGVESKGVRPRS